VILQEGIQGRLYLLVRVKGAKKKPLRISNWTGWGNFSALHFFCRELLERFPAKIFFLFFWKMPIHGNQQVSWEYADF